MEDKTIKKRGFSFPFRSTKSSSKLLEKSGKGGDKKSGKESRRGSDAGGSERMVDDDKDNIFEELSVEGAVHVKKTGMFSFLLKTTKEKAEGDGRIDIDNEEIVREEEELIADQKLEDKMAEVRFKDFEEVSRVQIRFENERKLLQRAEIRRFFSGIFLELDGMERDHKKKTAAGSIFSQIGALFSPAEEVHDFHDDHHGGHIGTKHILYLHTCTLA